MTTTTRLGLTKPAGSDLVDISVLNVNSDKIDAAVGAKVVTSGTRPSTPFDGQIIYETDTQKSYVYRSSTSSWVPVDKAVTTVTSSTRPPSPYDGQIIYESDTTRFYAWSGAWKNITGSSVVTTRPASPDYGQIIFDASKTAYVYTSDMGWVPVGVPTFATRSDRNTAIPSPVQGWKTFITGIGYAEQYYAAYNATTNPGGAATAGWYPAPGEQVGGALVRNAVATAANSGTYTNLLSAWDAGPSVGVATVGGTTGTITIEHTGMYLVNAQLFWASGAGDSYRYLWVTKNTTGIVTPPVANAVVESLVTPSFSYLAQNVATGIVKLTAGDVLRILVLQNSGSALSISDNSSALGNPSGLTVQWMGVAK